MSWRDHLGLKVADEGVSVVGGTLPRRKRASYSALSSWTQCPAEFAASALHPRRTQAMVVGSLAHAMLQIAMANVRKALDAGKKPDWTPDWKRLAPQALKLERKVVKKRGWGDDPAPAHVDDADKTYTAVDWYALACAKLKGFDLREATAPDTPDPAAEEDGWKDTLWGVPLQGSVDYRDRSGLLVDWKTGKNSHWSWPSQANELRIYARAMEKRGVKVKGLRDVYPADPQGIHTHDQPTDDDGFKKTGEMVSTAWKEMSATMGKDGTNLYQYRPSALCGWCPLARICPAARIYSAKAKKAAAGQLAPSDPLFTTRGRARTDANKKGSKKMLKVVENKPYDPTLPKGEKAVNVAGYGYASLDRIRSMARTLAGVGASADQVGKAQETLRKAIFAVARFAWPNAKNGGVDVLVSLLDTVRGREALRALQAALQPLLAYSPAVPADTMESVLHTLMAPAVKAAGEDLRAIAREMAALG